MKKMIIITGIIFFSFISIAYASKYTIDYNDWLTRSVGDTYYCLTDGSNCVLGNGSGGGNSSWNQTLADTLYDPIGSGTGNLSWNQTYADTLYANISTISYNTTFNQTYTDGLYATINGLWESVEGVSRLIDDENIDIQNKNITNVSYLSYNSNVSLRLYDKNEFIDGNVLCLEMFNNGEYLPHWCTQSGGASQASYWMRSVMIVNEEDNFFNTTNRTSCSAYMNKIGETLQIDCNTTTTGADLLVSDDFQVVDEVWLKDVDGEWHFMTRELELMDELRSDTVNVRINTSFNGSTFNFTEFEGRNLVVVIDEANNILDTNNDSIILTNGTNGTPLFQHVFYENGAAPSLTTATSDSEGKPDVAQYLLGGNGFQYGSIAGSANMFQFINGVYRRFFDDGARYISDFEINVTTPDVINISNGTMKLLLNRVTTTTNYSTKELTIEIHSDGEFHQHYDDFDGYDAYTSGESISNNRYFNIICGIVFTADLEGKMYCIPQNKPPNEHTLAVGAENDNTYIQFFPNNDFLKRIYIPVVRVIVQRQGGTSNVIQAFSDGTLFRDLRGTIVSTGGSNPVGGITSHSDLGNLNWASAGHTFDTDLDLVYNNLIGADWVNGTNFNTTNLCINSECISDWSEVNLSYIDGSGTTDFLAIFTDSNTIGNSPYDINVNDDLLIDNGIRLANTVTGEEGMIRYEISAGRFEGYTTTGWTIMNDNTTFNQTYTDGLYPNYYNHSFENLNVTGTFIKNISQFVEVCKSGCEYNTIQGGIDSITDASTSNRYVVLIYPGDYTENVKGKNHVFLFGYGKAMGIGASITPTSGAAYTAPSGLNGISNMNLKMEVTTSNNVVINHSSGITGITDCRLSITSSTNNVQNHIINQSGGVLVMTGGQIIYTMNGNAFGARLHKVIQKTGGAFDLYGTQASVTLAEYDDNIRLINEEGATNTFTRLSNNNFELYTTSSGYLGLVKFYAMQGEGFEKNIYGNIITMRSSGNGDSYVYYINTTDQSGDLHSSSNRITNTNYSNSYFIYANQTGDNVTSHFDDVIAINKSITNGGFDYVYSDEEGQLTLSNKIGIGTDSPNYAIHVREDSNDAAYMQLTNDLTGHSGAAGFYFGVDDNGDALLYTGLGTVDLIVAPYFGINGLIKFQYDGLVNVTSAQGIWAEEKIATNLGQFNKINKTYRLELGNLTTTASQTEALIRANTEYIDSDNALMFFITPRFTANTTSSTGAAIAGYPVPNGDFWTDTADNTIVNIAGLNYFGGYLAFSTVKNGSLGGNQRGFFSTAGVAVSGASGFGGRYHGDHINAMILQPTGAGGTTVASLSNTYNLTHLRGLLIKDAEAATYDVDDQIQLEIRQPTKGDINMALLIRGIGAGSGIYFENENYYMRRVFTNFVQTNFTLYPDGNTTDLGTAANAWGTVYAWNFVDLTPDYNESLDGEAIDSIMNIKSDEDGHINHTSYPKSTRNKHYKMNHTYVGCDIETILVNYTDEFLLDIFEELNVNMSLEQFYTDYGHTYQKDITTCKNKTTEVTEIVNEYLNESEQVQSLIDKGYSQQEIDNAETFYTRNLGSTISMSIKAMQDSYNLTNVSDTRLNVLDTGLKVLPNVTGTDIPLVRIEHEVSAEDYLSRTTVFDKNQGSALDLVKDSDDMKTNGEIDPSKIIGYKVIEYDGTVEHGISIGNKTALLEQALYEAREIIYTQNNTINSLNNEIELIKDELCNKNNTYSWCRQVTQT